MLRSLQFLQLCISQLCCLDIPLRPLGKVVELVLDFQAFQLEPGNNGHEHMVALRGDRPGRLLGQCRIAFQLLVELLDFSPFFVGRCDVSAIAREDTVN